MGLFDKEFQDFIKKWTGPHAAHLSDTDENDGQKLRDLIKKEYYTKKEVEQIYNEISLDLNCVVWITTKQRKLLDHILWKRFKEALK